MSNLNNFLVGKKILQSVSHKKTNYETGTNIIPSDDTIPQNTEGDEYFSATITPISDSSTLVIELFGNIFFSTQSGCLAVFKDSEANAIFACIPANGSGNSTGVVFKNEIISGSTVARTYKIRIGCDSSGTTAINGNASSRELGGISECEFKLTEIL